MKPRPLFYGSSPLALMLNAPLCGIHPNARKSIAIHAIELEQVPIRRTTGTAACGKQGVKVMGVPHGDNVLAAPFPPQAKGLPSRMVRCSACWQATGRKRPRITLAAGATK